MGAKAKAVGGAISISVGSAFLFPDKVKYIVNKTTEYIPKVADEVGKFVSYLGDYKFLIPPILISTGVAYLCYANFQRIENKYNVIE